MSISNGHVPHPVCYTKAMHENDETDFPPIPPPPPMTAEQRAQAEASILAALAREAERQARLMDTETCWDAALKDAKEDAKELYAKASVKAKEFGEKASEKSKEVVEKAKDVYADASAKAKVKIDDFKNKEKKA